MYYKIQPETIEDIARAIRMKSGASGDIQVKDFASAISELNVGENTESAAQSAAAASASAASAASSATAAAKSAGDAAANTSIVIGYAEAVVQNAELADNSKLDAEAWATGKRNGVEVTSDDETYENNAAYWAQKAKEFAAIVEMTEDEIQTLWDDIFKEGR